MTPDEHLRWTRILQALTSSGSFMLTSREAAGLAEMLEGTLRIEAPPPPPAPERRPPPQKIRIVEKPCDCRKRLLSILGGVGVVHAQLRALAVDDAPAEPDDDEESEEA